MPLKIYMILLTYSCAMLIFRFRDLLIIVVDEEQNIVLFNQGAELTFGYHASEVIGQKLEMLLPPQDTDIHHAHFRHFAKRANPSRLMGERKSIFARRKNGLIFPAEASIAKVSSVGKIFFTAILRDITERKIVEQALRQNAKKYSMLLNSVDEIIYQVNYPEGSLPHGTVEFVSEQTQEILGFRPTDFITDPTRWLSLIHPEDIATVQAQITSIMKTGQPGLHHYRIKDTNGEYRWMEDRVSPEKNKAGRVVRTFGTVRDITERKRAEAEREQLLNVLESSLNEIYIFDAETLRFQYVNQGALRNLGYNRETMNAMTPLDLKPEFDEVSFRKVLEPLLRLEQEKLIFYTVHRRADESLYPVEVHLQMSDFEGKRVFHAVILNITERKRAEEETAKLYNAVEQSGDIIFITDRNGMIEYVNPSFESITGYSKEESLGKSSNVMSSGLMDNEYYQKVWTTILSGEVFRGEIINRKKGGEIFYYDQTITPLKDEHGNITHFVSTGKDVTEGKQAEEQIRLRLGELEVLYENGLAINQVLQPKEIAQKIIDLLNQKLNWHHSAIRLYHPQDETLELLAFNQPGLSSEQEKSAVEERFKTSIAKKGQGLSGWVVAHGQSVRAHDLTNDTRYFETFPGLRSGLYVPIKIAETVIGVISIESEEAQAFSKADERLVATLANQAASALENARLFGETERRLKRLQSLHEIDKAITGSMDINLVLEVIIGQVISNLNADAAVILLYDQIEGTLKYAKGRGFHTQALQHTRLPIGESYAGRVALGRQMVHVPDIQTRKTDFLRSPTFSQEGFVSYFGVPLIAKGEIKGVLEVFHRTAIQTDNDWLNFLDTLAVQTAIAIDSASLFKNLQLSNIELHIAYDATIAGWSHAVELKDKETQNHTRRVTEMTETLAQALGMDQSELVHVRRGALLHDIGKMGIPDHILLKPDKLTDEEWDLMKQHPQFAYDMISPIAYLKPALDIPYCHHEKWDGTGYPQGMKGEQIPLAARIFAIVDVYDALTSDRPYRKAWSRENTLEYIRAQSGKHFEPQLVDVFIKAIDNFEES